VTQNSSWRHHYAPEFYLRQWTTRPDGLLYRYLREPSGIVSEKRVAPRRTGYEKNLYATPPTAPWENWSPDIIESQVMQRVDNDAAKVLAKLVALATPGEPVPATVGTDDAKAWARFLSSLIERQPDELAERDAFAEQLAVESVNRLRAMYTSSKGLARVDHALASFDHLVAARNTVRTLMVREINDPKFVDHITTKHEWSLYPALPEDDDFITCDRPLIVNATAEERRPIWTLTLPLGPRLLFVSHPKHWRTDDPVALDEAIGATVAYHNLFVLQAGARCIYSARKIVDGTRIRLRTAIDNAFGKPSVLPRVSVSLAKPETGT
jgi:hypothetical protein